jgi:hypothetical protein
MAALVVVVVGAILLTQLINTHRRKWWAVRWWWRCWKWVCQQYRSNWWATVVTLGVVVVLLCDPVATAGAGGAGIIVLYWTEGF